MTKDRFFKDIWIPNGAQQQLQKVNRWDPRSGKWLKCDGKMRKEL